jgi:hypothetical protein
MPRPAIKNVRDPSKTLKQSFMMKGSDINFIITLAGYLGISQSEVIHILIEMAKEDKKIFSKSADMLEERARKLRILEKGGKIEELEEGE